MTGQRRERHERTLLPRVGTLHTVHLLPGGEAERDRPPVGRALAAVGDGDLAAIAGEAEQPGVGLAGVAGEQVGPRRGRVASTVGGAPAPGAARSPVDGAAPPPGAGSGEGTAPAPSSAAAGVGSAVTGGSCSPAASTDGSGSRTSPVGGRLAISTA
ncbi:hypothetical protein Psuf_008020 [Phytohabitans suffuscus]|uniref:Uncharacterized protein n=1 Tax=Phytohabitans suffuscus TaxID=624315 RepID=A0A6F8YBT0_9ACTN|nr:hypothetical protein Psuf_008020 [Phytohabitans suffuscus]